MTIPSVQREDYSKHLPNNQFEWYTQSWDNPSENSFGWGYVMAFGLTLSSSARLALIGLAYVYTVKLLDTVWHGIFSFPPLSFTVVALNIWAGIAQFLFFYTLKVSISQRTLFTDIGGWAGVAGAVINLFPKLLALSSLLHYYFSIALPRYSQAIAVLGPWVGAVLLCCCCLMLSLSSVESLNEKKRYFVAGTIGYLIVVGISSTLLYRFVSGSPVRWQQGEIGTSTASFIVTASAAFLCIAYFYSGFFHGNAPGKEDTG